MQLLLIFYLISTTDLLAGWLTECLTGWLVCGLTTLIVLLAAVFSKAIFVLKLTNCTPWLLSGSQGRITMVSVCSVMLSLAGCLIVVTSVLSAVQKSVTSATRRQQQKTNGFVCCVSNKGSFLCSYIFFSSDDVFPAYLQTGC